MLGFQGHLEPHELAARSAPSTASREATSPAPSAERRRRPPRTAPLSAPIPTSYANALAEGGMTRTYSAICCSSTVTSPSPASLSNGELDLAMGRPSGAGRGIRAERGGATAGDPPGRPRPRSNTRSESADPPGQGHVHADRIRRHGRTNGLAGVRPEPLFRCAATALTVKQGPSRPLEGGELAVSRHATGPLSSCACAMISRSTGSPSKLGQVGDSTSVRAGALIGNAVTPDKSASAPARTPPAARPG